MNDFYKDLMDFKKRNDLTFKDLGEIINISPDAFRMACNKKSLSDNRKRRLLKVMNSDMNSNNDELFYYKDGVKFYIDEIISFIILNIKQIKNKGKLEKLIEAINHIENIKRYNELNDEIQKIKDLLLKNKNNLK
ncbi:hypothetical protein [Tenacibaculum sp. SG-28]|uniref:hypothetical protein n=1 Tax=Tenacibaculum sp. SG-28 TaxID=754426 RepID=UPI000CF3D08F|nr:hypothetical protein [Tenacibaculum sp. SG-28]PQJ20780.1 hypothetical protein BSU00_10910 [Tenacibaculum sp. SG-28]